MEHLLPVEGAVLCARTAGDPRDPALLLLGGAGAALDAWDDELCGELAAGGRFVVRYDHRDTGRSTTCPPGIPDYTGDDLVADPVGILDALGIERAHLLGMSMGGGIAQALALTQPDRVATLTLLSTTPLVHAGDELPAPEPPVLAVFLEPPPAPDWSDAEAVVRYLAEAERPFQGPAYDPERSLASARRSVERARNPASAANHWLLDGEPPEGSLADVAAPTLVLHGAADPLFPPAHARALADAIPGARLVLLDGMGHQYPPPETWPVVVPEVLAHTER